MSKSAAVITGLGPISAIGCGRKDFWQALVAGQHGFGPITLCDVTSSPAKIGAEVKDFYLGNFIKNGHMLAKTLPRPVQFALASAALALEDARIDLETCDRNRIGVCMGTSLGNLAGILDARDTLLAKRKVKPSRAFQLFHHSAACCISSIFDLRGPIETISSGCNSGLDALGVAMRMILMDMADVILVIGTDCELIPEVMAALNASNSLATRFNDEPGRASRPFDIDRNGNVIGEGAAALLLEKECNVIERRGKVYARLSGHSVSAAGRNRRYHHRRPELDFAPSVRAIRDGLQQANLKPVDVDLINANGSSSVLYDKLEALAFSDAFNCRFPEIRIHSIKSMLGQHGAGSSALQAVSACLTIAEGTIPPTINCEHADPACGPIRVVTKKEKFRAKNLLVHSIGFGGFYYSCGVFTSMN